MSIAVPVTLFSFRAGIRAVNASSGPDTTGPMCGPAISRKVCNGLSAPVGSSCCATGSIVCNEDVDPINGTPHKLKPGIRKVAIPVLSLYCCATC